MTAPTTPSEPSGSPSGCTDSVGCDPSLAAPDGADSAQVPCAPEAKSDEFVACADFESMGLPEPLLRGIYSLGFEKPSPIQQKAIVPAAAGRDVTMHAQSGTGKTGAFATGLLARIDSSVAVTQALILSPTRELALQTQRVVIGLGDYSGIKCHLSIGGRSGRDDGAALRRGPHVVTGTPGRVIDNMQRGSMQMKWLKTIVLDECDVMLSEGFREDVYTVFQHIPEQCQVIIVSATFPPEVHEISKKFMRDPVKILIPTEDITLAGIKQFYVDCGEDAAKFAVLMDLYEVMTISQSVIFVNTRRKAQWLAEEMNAQDHSVSCIHSDMEPPERELTMREFVNGATRVLIATDVLARGIDVQQVSCVMNFDLPPDRENYIHRIGRGGRMGRKAVAINLITQYDANKIVELERFYACQIEEMPQDVASFMA